MENQEQNVFEGLPDDSLKQLQESEVIIADYNLIAPYLYCLPKARWVQGTWAGAEPIFKAYDASKPPLPFVISRFSGESFGAQMAEYVVAAVVNRERRFPYFRECQRSHFWDKNDMFVLDRSIQDLTFTVLGLGNIGDRVASVLHALGASVWGVGRSERNTLPPYVHQYRTLAGLREALAAADYVVNVLPGTSGTEGLLGGGVLEACAARRAVLVNVGRGSIVSEGDLLEALRRGWLGGAVLDVDITPHIAGYTRPQDVASFFCINLARYIAKQPLLMPLDLERRY
ncbi:Glyoxylate/hydroxypyruvate reductase A [Gryllus bimaculatus]|nr:Glyoxylate/hydroxypyruvate reductase A [Gryllus bimaculatus]